MKELQKIVPLKPNEQQFTLIDLIWRHNLKRWGEVKEGDESNGVNPS